MVRPALIGLGIGSDSLRIVLQQNGVTTWREELRRGSPEALTADIVRLLESCPRTRWRRPSLVAAVGPAHSAFRRVHGIPSGASPADATKAMRQDPARFFIVQESTVTLTAAKNFLSGWWGGYIDQTTMRAVSDACAKSKVRLLGVAPTLALLRPPHADNVIEWQDGPDLYAMTFTEDGPVDSPRRTRPPSDDLPPRPHHFADAAAALVSGPTSFALVDPNEPIRRECRHRTLRRGLIGLSCAVFLGGLIGPGLLATYQARAAIARTAAVAPKATESFAIASSVYQLIEASRFRARFMAERPAVLPLLHSLAERLPSGSAIVSLRIQSDGVSIVALTPSSAEYLAALAAAPGLRPPQLIGPVIRESVNGIALHRVATESKRTSTGTLAPGHPLP